MAKKKILLLSDDLRLQSGIATMSREIILNTVKEFDWVQLGAAERHPDHLKVFDLSEDVKKQTGVEDASVKIYAHTGYGSQEVLRDLIQVERPDAILHFTDPRFWGWLYAMEHELRQICPLAYYTIWDCDPAPMWNRPFYESCDLLMCISKQTYNLVKQVLKDKNYKDWQVTYVPHGINHTQYYPITLGHPERKEFEEFKNKVVKDSKFVLYYNARNVRRKHTSDVILSYKHFCDQLSKEEAAKCLLLLHTDPVDENGTDLFAVIKAMCPDYPIKFTVQALNQRLLSIKELNFLNNLADVSINLASNEGFGLGTAESVMSGTPIIVNVTGGLQDQCGFMKEDGSYLNEHDYNENFLTNANKIYTIHAPWSKPVFPGVRTLQGSVPTPYIFDDIPDYKAAAFAIMSLYETPTETRKEYGMKGREHFMSTESGLCAEEMGNRLIRDMNTMFQNWKPRERFELIKS